MLKRIFAVTFSILLLLMSSTATAFAAPAVQKRIRVGVSEQQGYFERTPNGDFTGLLHEYFDEISKYANWDFQYIVSDRESLQKMLKNNEIDIISGSFRSKELENDFLFPDFVTGYVNVTLNTSLENTKISRYDPHTLNGSTIGVSGIDDMYLNTLKTYLAVNHIPYQLTFFDSYETLNRALSDKKIDAIVSTNTQAATNQRVAAVFDRQPLYPITNKENPALMAELNEALQGINTAYPEYDRMLYDKYIEWYQSSALILNESEQEYIKNADIIDVAIYPVVKPLQYFNNDKEFSGITADIFKIVSEKTGLKFRFTPISSYSDYLTNLEQGRFTMVSAKSRYMNYDLSGLIEQTWPYWGTSCVIIKNKSVDVLKQKKLIQASVYGSSFPKIYKDVSYIYYDTFSECLAAVDSGVADLSIENMEIMEYNLQQKAYNNVIFEPLSDSNYDLCLGITRPIDGDLLSIINKTLYNIPQSQVGELIHVQTTEASRQFGLLDYFAQNPKNSLIILAVIFGTLVALLLFIVKIRLEHAKHLYRLSNIDSVTGASSSMKFKLDAQKALRDKQPRAMIAIDIKKFTIINDMFGHVIGDKLLKDIADILQKRLLSNEYFTRMNADIFYILANYYSNENTIAFLQSIGESIFTLIEGYMVEMSYGIYVIPEDLIDVDIICDRTNLACRAAKGKVDENYFFFNEDLRNAILMEQEMTNMADEALINNEFRLYFQPQHLFKDGSLIGAEALVRWDNSLRGFILPDNFIPLFEKNGFIKKLDKYMFTEVCRYLKSLHTAFPDAVLPIISVNFSRLHFSNLNLASELLAIANANFIDPGILEIELTESAVYYNEEHFITILQALKKAGFRLALDDFGTGYSSLNTLKDLPVDTIKLDKGFLDKSTDTPRGKNIIQCLIVLAKAVDLSTVVEGVETQEQADFLSNIGCDVAQGYFYARPMPDNDFLTYWYQHMD